ncbi:uncharacterized protein V2V93DRAFT_378986 [Kockiozyma suomiensis]|uniref:uncharacterized protein n=1 Tax=Kockiozyma suomiensis TaxID=1337062 RepID=UPI00334346E9
MIAMESSGLPSPNPSVDMGCFPAVGDDKAFDRAFERVLKERSRSANIYDERAETFVNPLPTPNSEACLSSDECDEPVSRDQSPKSASNSQRAEFPFPQVDLSLFYPDTAPRQSWRPQIETWIRRNHSYKFDRITASRPYSNGSSSSLATSSSGAAQRKTASSSSHKSSSPKKNAATSASIDHAYVAKFVDDKSDVDLGLISPSPSPKPAAATLHSNHSGRKCISCGSDQSPCWRPSWSVDAGQLCNSCGLRYKKTGARCLSSSCGRIPAKGEWVTMRSTQSAGRYSCLYCGGGVAVGENSKR